MKADGFFTHQVIIAQKEKRHPFEKETTYQRNDEFLVGRTPSDEWEGTLFRVGLGD
jgi:hypothetical protein